jgi:phosphoribosylanthranilate isomerase
MTRVKICGITNLEDALAAVDYGADALGFIFVPGSPRYVGANAEAKQIPALLPPFVSCVAVCKELTEDHFYWLRGFNTKQYYVVKQNTILHRTESRIHAFPIQDETSLDLIAAGLELHRPDALLLDTYHKDKLGGSGETFNWELAKEAKARFGLPILLAGGLTPENVGDAIAAVRPYAVDVSSGVEAAPGRKDHAKLKAFFRAVRKADAACSVGY